MLNEPSLLDNARPYIKTSALVFKDLTGEFAAACNALASAAAIINAKICCVAASAASSEAATTENTSDTAALYTTAAESSVGSADQFVKPDPSSMKDPVPVGIILSDASYLNSTGAYTGTVAILGITQNTSRSDEALRFIDFLNQ